MEYKPFNWKLFPFFGFNVGIKFLTKSKEGRIYFAKCV